MKTFRITWTEETQWESYVKAETEEEARKDIDQINENAEQLENVGSAYNIDCDEVEE